MNRTTTTELEALEALARKLEISADQRHSWNATVMEYADQFLDELPERKAFDARPDRGALLNNVPVEKEGKPLEQLLALLHDHVDRNGINPASGRHLGYIPGGGIYHSALGDYLAAVTNRYAGMFFASPGAVRIENSLIRWMCQLVGLPETSHGNLISGGSLANLIAVTTARDVRNVKAIDMDKQVVYVTQQTHHCIQKAFRIAGMREAQVRYIPTDNNFRMNAEMLRQAVGVDIRHGLQPFMIVGSGGTTDTGAIDPLQELADVAEEHDIWYHVDAAYGGFYLLSEKFAPHFRGIERAHSVVIDPHKGLFVPYGLGVVLIRDVKNLLETYYHTASYLQDALGATEEMSPADLSPELSKHFRGLRLWLPLHLLGTEPFRAALEEKALLCRYFYQRIQDEGFTVGPPPELSVMIYRYVPDQGEANAFNEALVQYIQQQGRVFLSSTRIDGVFWIRLAVLSFRTHRQEIDEVIRVLREGVAYLLAK